MVQKVIVTFRIMISFAKEKLQKSRQVFTIKRSEYGIEQEVNDKVITEAPLEITIGYGSANQRKKEVLSVTMRTPGDDFNLVMGFLFAEHIIHRAADVISMRFTGNYKEEVLQENSLLAELSPDVQVDFSAKRKFLTNAACGFCGKSAFDVSGNEGIYLPLSTDKHISSGILYQLPAVLSSSQTTFAETGGSHAVALFSFDGALIKIFEDVGRHNAMDKLVGFMLKEQSIPLINRIALFSGRLSYELVQKSLAAGIPVVCSIGAPSSLAIELASDYNMTLLGFLRKDRMNIYCGSERIVPDKKF